MVYLVTLIELDNVHKTKLTCEQYLNLYFYYSFHWRGHTYTVTTCCTYDARKHV